MFFLLIPCHTPLLRPCSKAHRQSILAGSSDSGIYCNIEYEGSVVDTSTVMLISTVIMLDYLSVFIDSKLTFGDHMKYIKNKTYDRIQVLE